MADENTTAEVTETTTTETTETAPVELGDAGKKALDVERDARKAAERERNQLRQEIEQIRQSSMSESEKAVAEAEAKGRQAAATEFGARLVKSEYVAAAARRNPGFDAAGVLDDLNLSRFVTDDGEPDTAAIAASVERLIPAPNGAPSFDGGARSRSAAAGPEADFAAFLKPHLGR